MQPRETGVRDILQQLTGGKPYVFVVMEYKGKWDLYQRIKHIVEQEFDVACIRADHIKLSGHDLLAKVHGMIARADVVIADIGTDSPNVFYEVGYSVAIQKPPLLLIEKGKDVPTDLKGLERIEHTSDREGVFSFERELADHLRQRFSTEIALLRDMLEPQIPRPAFIVAHPKYPTAQSRIAGQVYDARTFGDNLGIVGLLSAFGSTRGEASGVELISAQYYPPELLKEEWSLYLIGSRKVNKVTGQAMDLLQGARKAWSFDPDEGYTEEDEDWPVMLYRWADDRRTRMSGVKEVHNETEIWTEDFGLIMRGPNPNHDERLVFVMAGAHSLGTGAACVAATRSAYVQGIRSKLPEGIIEDKTRSFWVLVKGRVAEDKLLDLDGIEIVEAGVIK